MVAEDISDSEHARLVMQVEASNTNELLQLPKADAAIAPWSLTAPEIVLLALASGAACSMQLLAEDAVE